MSTAQTLIDRLGHRLGRALALDGPAFEIIAFTARIGRSDDVWTASVLDRRTQPEIGDWLRSLRLDEADPYRRVPGRADYQTLDRVCFPVRSRGRLLAYLWAIDEPRFTEAELARISAALPELAAQLEWQGAPVRSTIGEAARLALGYAIDGDDSALREARSRGLLASGGSVVVMRAAVEDGDRPVTRARLQTVLEETLGALTGTIAGLREDGLVLVSDRSAEIADVLTRVAARRGLRVSAIGEARGNAASSGAELHARAAFAAERDPVPPPPLTQSWESLGAWTLLFRREHPCIAEISPAVGALLAGGRTDLAETWLVYLDENRDAPRSCARMHIGRATLYHRLQRIRECVGEDAFADGWSTTSAHVALRVWAAGR